MKPMTPSPHIKGAQDQPLQGKEQQVRAGSTGVEYELMQTVLNNMGEGVALFDRDFRLRFINRQLVDRL